MIRPATKTRACHGERGFSLVELMVAMLISLILLLAMTGLLINMNRNNAELRKTNMRIENGRFAVQLLQNEIGQAGFWGGFIPQFDDLTAKTVPSDVPASLPGVCIGYSAAGWDDAYQAGVLGMSVQVFDAVPPGCADVVLNHKAGTDVLVVRRADSCIAGTPGCADEATGQLYLQTSDCATELTGTPPRRYLLGIDNFTLHQKDCAEAAGKRRFLTSIYYVRTYADTTADGIATLVRSDLTLSAGGTVTPSAAVPLIEGVDMLRLQLGVDSLSKTGAPVNYAQTISWENAVSQITATNRGDGIPDGNFIRCTTAAPCTADQMINVVAVRLHLLVRNTEATLGYSDRKTYDLGGTTFGPFNDAFLRQSFSSTVRLTNIAGRRELP